MGAHLRNLLLTGKYLQFSIWFWMELKVFDFISTIPNRKSMNYSDDDAYYKSKEAHNSYGSITAIKNR